MYFSKGVLLLLFIIQIYGYGACSGYHDDHYLQTGVVEFINSFNSKTSCVTVQVNYKVSGYGFQAAVSTNNLYEYKPSSGLDYSVRAGRKDNLNLLALSLIVEDDQWKKISVSYLVSSRTDLYIGSFIADIFSLFGCDSTNIDKGVISHTVHNLPQIKGKYNIELFISGIKTDDNSIALSLWEPRVDEKNGIIKVNVKSNASPAVQNLHLNYVIWATVQFNIFTSIDIQKQRADYQIVGVIKFSQSKPEYLGLFIDFERLECVGYGCKSECVSPHECKKYFGKIVKDICYICGTYQKFWGGKCMPNCGTNEVLEDGKCVCQQGYKKIGSFCKPICGINEIWYDGKCKCKADHAFIDGVCRPCPPNSWASKDQKSCICKKNYQWNPEKRTCDYIVCPPYSEIAYVKGKYICQCDEGYTWYRGKCILDCGKYEVLKNGKCVCEEDYIIYKGECTACPPNSWPSKDGSSCECKNNYYWNSYKNTADYLVCPPYSKMVYKSHKYSCECDNKYFWFKGKCVPECGNYEVYENGKCVCQKDYINYKGQCTACPPNSWPSKDGKSCEPKKDYHWNSYDNTCGYLVCGDYEHIVYEKYNYKCICDDGCSLYNGKCRPTISCPPRSIWNQKKLKCVCTEDGEHLIGNQCKPCQKYEGWNGSECVCRTGYHKIEGVCRTCPSHSFYNGRDCICNHGYFGNADKCEKCHESCGKCSGKDANQCISCSDVSYDLVDGYCTRNIPCPTGLYLDGKQCKPCSSYCAKCQSETVCNTCIDGFKLEELEMYGVFASFCSQVCGDGKRFELDCDDGNKKNGDGCSKECQVEKGYICQGGSSINPSTCVSHKISNTYITLKGSVHMFGKIVQGIRLSYIPQNLTNNECAECSKLLWVRVIDSQVVPGVRIKYLPNSKYQFLAQFEFHGLFAIPVYSISIQLNPNYVKYFSDSDMAQIKIKTIDPAVLAKVDTRNEDENTLNFGQITENERRAAQKIFDD